MTLKEFKQWRSEEDIIIEDRGFRDSLELIQELGIQAEMPSSVKKGNLNYQQKKATPQEWSPKKIRCFVELVKGRLKLWIYIDRILPNSQIYLHSRLCQNSMCLYELILVRTCYKR